MLGFFFFFSGFSSQQGFGEGGVFCRTLFDIFLSENLFLFLEIL